MNALTRTCVDHAYRNTFPRPCHFAPRVWVSLGRGDALNGAKMKTCFKCLIEKPLTEFYAHPMMADGHLGKCKECNKKDVRENYRNKHGHYLSYEKGRSASRKEYRRERFEIYCLLNPIKRTARCAVSNAVRDGRLTKYPCHICGDPKSEAHHANYSKPLDVEWLCRTHHRMREGRSVFGRL